MTALLKNAPAEPAVLFAEEVNDLYDEAKNFLDGDPVADAGQADAVSSLLNRLRRVSKDADDARKTEAKPFDDGKKAVQSKWKPIIDKADLAATTAKQALAPWLRKVEDEQRAIAEAARQEADRLAEEARQAHRNASGNLEASEAAEALLDAAKDAEKSASRAEKAKAHATGGERAVGLVDRFTPELVDPVEALKHYRATKPQALKDWLLEQAAADVRAGSRSIPGFTVHHERVAR